MGAGVRTETHNHVLAGRGEVKHKYNAETVHMGPTSIYEYPPVPTAAVEPARNLPTDSAERKKYPVGTGLLDYFPDACAEVAFVSWHGNEKHNPGEPLHWARGKSMDHADCILRHFIERGGFDGPIRHTAALAWRAMALLQEELEAEKGLSMPRGARVNG